jgi:hypothetical protein
VISPQDERPRRIAAIVCLVFLIAAEIASLKPGELKGRAGALAFFSRKDPDDALLGGSGFASIRRLGPFLRGVSLATPPTATIALSYASEKGDLATYASAYVLAPRRVVPAARAPEADFAATFRNRPDPSAIPVPFGDLVRLR